MSTELENQQHRATAFRALHQGAGAFVLPNPWDAGSAKMLAGLGFQALATSSAALANTLGRQDGEVSLADKVAHCSAICAATRLPVSADLENGFGDSPAAVAKCLREVAAVGVVGGSIEDYTGSTSAPIYDAGLAVERIAAAVAAVAEMPHDFVLTARCENFLHGNTNLDQTIERLVAYAGAGADVVYAPGLSTLAQVREVVAAVDVPVNLLAPFFAGNTVDELAAAGAKRLSLGSGLFNATLKPLIDASQEMLEQGSFGWLSGMVGGGQIAKLMKDA